MEQCVRQFKHQLVLAVVTSHVSAKLVLPVSSATALWMFVQVIHVRMGVLVETSVTLSSVSAQSVTQDSYILQRLTNVHRTHVLMVAHAYQGRFPEIVMNICACVLSVFQVQTAYKR
ncbi:uncharacterized protein [Ptychodera flava]|uniref:uncharacterized protein n=1 Tax=Ptychodera flava TaxID=63121 RepID=UPI003969FF88